jgi:CheY-like chemotaxis protein
MNGRLWQVAPSSDGGEQAQVQRGVALRFTIRLGSAAQGTQATTIKKSQNACPRRVLIVEDNETHRRILKQELERAGLDVVCAASASEGFERLQERASVPIGAVIVDWEMPVANGAALIERIRSRNMHVAVVAMLNTNTQRAAVARCRELKVNVHLSKPFLCEDLLEAIDSALKSPLAIAGSPSAVHEGAMIADAAQMSPEREVGLNVLVAEDNLVNQMVMRRLLQKRQHRITIASSGRAAVEAFEAQRFDLILMDVQMPELDGLAATQQIRKLETNGVRTPIVALTAHALSGDRERCLAAGMDGYMTKPVDPAELDDVLARYAGTQQEAHAQQS